MADEVQRSGNDAGPTWGQVVRARFYGRLLLMLAIGVVLMALIGLELVGTWTGLAVFAVLVVLAAIVPDTGGTAAAAGAAAAAGDPVFADAVRLFADALPEPCIVLDRRSTVLHLNAAAAQHFPAVAVGAPLAFTFRFPRLLSAIDAVRNTAAAASFVLLNSVPTETW
jgi:two-component system phosphate regulon sensor histidine kinase PhoR